MTVWKELVKCENYKTCCKSNRITTLAPNSLAAKGYEAMEDSGESQRLLGVDVERQKALGQGGGKQIVGNALETAGWLYGTGKVANLAMEQAVKQGVKKFGTKLAKEGFISTALGSSGSQLSEKGKIDAKQLAKDVAIGTVLTPVAGIGLSKVLGKLGSKASKEIEPSVMQVVDTKTGNVEFKTIPKGQLKDFHNKIDDTQVGIAGKEIDGKVYHLTAKTPEAMERAGAVNKGIATLDEVPTTTKIQTEQVTPEIKTTPEVKTQNISKDVNKIVQDTPNIEDYQPGTFEDWSKTIRGLDINEAKRVAMGGDKTIQNNIPKNAYLSIMKNIAEETGDVKLAKELAFSDVSSKGGQELVSSKIANTDNVTDTLREIRLSKLKRFNVDEKVFNRNADETVKNIKNQIDNMSSKKSTIEEVREIIKDLICK